MKQAGNILIGILGAGAFLAAGLWILVWDIRMLRLTHASADWPVAEGMVVSSSIDIRGSEKLPHVVYVYFVDGAEHRSSRISFDQFGRPGGAGSVETIIARYPQGQLVNVFYDPRDAGRSILEPGQYAPFLSPLLFAFMFLLGGGCLVFATIRSIRGTDSRPIRASPASRQMVISALLSVLIYAALIVTTFDSKVREVQTRAFGERPLGIPNLEFLLVLQTALYLPMPWVFWHTTALVIQAREDGVRPGFVYLFRVGQMHSHLRCSQRVCFGGLIYFLTIAGAWIAFASSRGL